MEHPNDKPEEHLISSDLDAQSQTSSQAGAAEVFPASPLPEKPARKGFFHFLFNPETGFGRFMRKLVRGLALVIGLFALGALTVYILLLRPLQTQYKSSQAELETARQSLSSLTQEVGGLRTRSGTLEASFNDEQAHVTLLNILQDATLARAELLAGDAAAATAALERGKKALTGLDEVMLAANADLTTTIKGRLDLALTEIGNDPDTAVSDLVILADKLEEMEKLLFPASN